VGHEVGRALAMVRFLCELEWGKGERRGRGSLNKEACERQCLREEKEKGLSEYGDEGENREPTRTLGKEGRTVQQDEVSVAQRCDHARATHVGPATDGAHWTCSDNDLVCVA
jgi:hypothetical protein